MVPQHPVLLFPKESHLSPRLSPYVTALAKINAAPFFFLTMDGDVAQLVEHRTSTQLTRV